MQLLCRLLQICLLTDYVMAAILSNKERKEILDAHNYFRRLVTSEMSATDMRLMRWDFKLEEFAANYLKQCKFKHSSNKQRENKALTGFWYIGESLLWRADSRVIDLPENLTIALKSFYDEKNDYHYNTNFCNWGQQCGHYTQMVWAESYALGCALTRCTDGLHPKFKSQVIMSCVYGPGGNIVGQKPYKRGDGGKCSGCVSKQGDIAWGNYCINGLCSDTRNPPDPSSAVRPVLTVNCLTLVLLTLINKLDTLITTV